MPDGQAARRDRHHRAFQNHKGDLLISQKSVEALAQLCDAEDGAD